MSVCGTSLSVVLASPDALDFAATRKSAKGAGFERSILNNPASHRARLSRKGRGGRGEKAAPTASRLAEAIARADALRQRAQWHPMWSGDLVCGHVEYQNEWLATRALLKSEPTSNRPCRESARGAQAVTPCRQQPPIPSGKESLGAKCGKLTVTSPLAAKES